MPQLFLLQESRIVPASVGGPCSHCSKGTYLRGGKGELVCSACSRRILLPPASKASTNGHQPDQSESALTEGDVFVIVDALTEQYLRAKGNIRRSRLETTRRLNTEKAGYLDELIERVKRL